MSLITVSTCLGQNPPFCQTAFEPGAGKGERGEGVEKEEKKNKKKKNVLNQFINQKFEQITLKAIKSSGVIQISFFLETSFPLKCRLTQICSVPKH